MNFVDRDIPLDACTPAPHRPICGVVLHDTEGSSAVMPRRGASWHWLIDRDGTIYRDVSEEHCAHHVAGCDEWRPAWVVPSPVRASDANYCTIGIELVSNQACRDAGEPYTDAQYASLRELAQDIERRHGPLPWAGHGQLQLDRTDPVMLDWRRAGFGDPDANGRRWQSGAAQPASSRAAEAGEADLKAYFEQLGHGVNMDSAIVKRACLAYRSGETRGPALSDEYQAVAPDGRNVVRQKFTAGIAEYDPATGEVAWVEIVRHPETLAD